MYESAIEDGWRLYWVWNVEERDLWRCCCLGLAEVGVGVIVVGVAYGNGGGKYDEVEDEPPTSGERIGEPAAPPSVKALESELLLWEWKGTRPVPRMPRPSMLPEPPGSRPTQKPGPEGSGDTCLLICSGE